MQRCARAGAGELDVRATSLATLVRMASSSTHVTLLPSLAVSVENRRGQLRVRPFTKPSPARTLVLAWRKGPAVRELMGRIAEVVRKAAGLG